MKIILFNFPYPNWVSLSISKVYPFSCSRHAAEQLLVYYICKSWWRKVCEPKNINNEKMKCGNRFMSMAYHISLSWRKLLVLMFWLDVSIISTPIFGIRCIGLLGALNIYFTYCLIIHCTTVSEWVPSKAVLFCQCLIVAFFF